MSHSQGNLEEVLAYARTLLELSPPSSPVNARASPPSAIRQDEHRDLAAASVSVTSAPSAATRTAPGQGPFYVWVQRGPPGQAAQQAASLSTPVSSLTPPAQTGPALVPVAPQQLAPLTLPGSNQVSASLQRELRPSTHLAFSDSSTTPSPLALPRRSSPALPRRSSPRAAPGFQTGSNEEIKAHGSSLHIDTSSFVPSPSSASASMMPNDIRSATHTPDGRNERLPVTVAPSKRAPRLVKSEAQLRAKIKYGEKLQVKKLVAAGKPVTAKRPYTRRIQTDEGGSMRKAAPAEKAKARQLAIKAHNSKVRGPPNSKQRDKFNEHRRSTQRARRAAARARRDGKPLPPLLDGATGVPIVEDNSATSLGRTASTGSIDHHPGSSHPVSAKQ